MDKYHLCQVEIHESIAYSQLCLEVTYCNVLGTGYEERTNELLWYFISKIQHSYYTIA